MTQNTNTDLLVPDIIAPEGMTVAESYLANGGDSRKVCIELDLPASVVEKQLKKPEVSGYINRMFSETGFRNRNRLFGLLDQVINIKLEEMEETGLGSTMDIMDILKASHTMKMQELKMEAELVKASVAAAPTNQTNIQVNNSIPGSNDPAYMNVLDLLTAGKK
jgi:hypothetical protein